MSQDPEIKDITVVITPEEATEPAPVELTDLEDVNGGADVTLTLGVTVKL